METKTSPVISSTARAQAVLLAFSTPPAGDEAAFTTWYQGHAAARLTVPGVLNARRYKATQDDGPRFMAYYDLESPSALQTPEYKNIVTDADREMMPRLPLLDRRVLKLVMGTEAWTDDPPYVLTVALEPVDADDLVAWYREEHIPMLLQVPGWRRSRLFELLEGEGPRFCAFQEIESPAVFDTPEYKKAGETPWRERVIGRALRRERHLWQLLATFPRPSWGER